MKRSINVHKKPKEQDESIKRSQREEKKSNTESFNSFVGCLKGYDLNEANDLTELRKEEDKRLERLVGVGRSGTKKNAVALKKRIQKGEI